VSAAGQQIKAAWHTFESWKSQPLQATPKKRIQIGDALPKLWRFSSVTGQLASQSRRTDCAGVAGGQWVGRSRACR
jgi:hypothetical protein